jgi:hypothetical protein
MNDCFLAKWILKIFHEPDELWFKIVKAKYMDEDGFFGSKTKGVSQFWQGLHKVKHMFKWGAVKWEALQILERLLDPECTFEHLL